MSHQTYRTRLLPQHAIKRRNRARAVYWGVVLGLLLVLTGAHYLLPRESASSAFPDAGSPYPAAGVPTDATASTSRQAVGDAGNGAGTPVYATGGENGSLLLGNPSGADHEPDNYLLEKPQYSLAYNRGNGTANWVAWHLEESDLSSEPRGDFFADPLLPSDWQIQPDAYRYSETGYERGHLCPSADRTSTRANNDATFAMSNIIPQTSNLNQGAWARLEGYCRSLARDGNELYVVAGGADSQGRLANNRVNVPQSCWKVILVLPEGADDLARINQDTRVIAVVMPNQDTPALRRGGWEPYLTSVAQVEAVSHDTFFSALPPDMQTALKQKVDTGSR